MPMKKKYILIIILLLCVICFIYRTNITSFVITTLNQYSMVENPENNDYSTNYKFGFVQTTDDFHVKNKQGILNVIYTILNSGQDEFTFYCDVSYDSCTDDLKEISSDSELLSVINNLVAPYNSYEKLYVTTNSYNQGTIKIEKLYSDNDINKLNKKVKEVETDLLNDGMSNLEKIKAIHDYIINNTIYDEERAKQIESGNDKTYKYNSHKANGPLLEGMGLCSGYSDAMKLFLDDLNIPNYKIANADHIWNLVYIDSTWKHLDLTWDDPVTQDHSNVLLDKFFLIDTDKVLRLDQTNHTFNKEYYPETNA